MSSLAGTKQPGEPGGSPQYNVRRGHEPNEMVEGRRGIDQLIPVTLWAVPTW